MYTTRKEVRRQGLFKAIGIVEVSDDETRAELPAGVPAPFVSESAAPELGKPIGIQEVAALIGCSPWTVRQQCLPQGLPHFRASRTGRLIFYREQVVRWLIQKQTERR